MMMRCGGVVVLELEAVQQQLRGVRPDRCARPADRRQRHAQQIAERDVADADDGDVVGHAQAGLPDRFHRADRRRIVGREHRVDPRPRPCSSRFIAR